MSDSLTPFFFGPIGKQLFGVYYAPPPELARDFGVLLCNPMGQEYVRAHRAMLQIALRLARLGFPVLRFDYFAQGDSTGEDEQGTLAQWQEDVRAAITELERRARVESVFVAGLRLGASLAAQVASGREDVEGLALWEPVTNGSDYLDELIAWNQDKLWYFLSGEDGDQSTWPTKISANSRISPIEILGFALHPSLTAEIQALDLLALLRKPASRLLVIESDAKPPVAALCNKLQQLGAAVDYRCIESFKIWTEDPDKGLVPQPIIQAIVDWFTAEGE